MKPLRNQDNQRENIDQADQRELSQKTNRARQFNEIINIQVLPKHKQCARN